MPIYERLMSDDALRELIILDPIGHGGARNAYRVINDPTVVIKEVHTQFTGVNHKEWLIWNAVCDSDWRHAFGECFAISHTGRFLMMECLNNIETTDYPETPTVPSWVRDVWPNNFGRNAQSIIKIRDYANTDLPELLRAAEGHRMVWQQ